MLRIYFAPPRQRQWPRCVPSGGHLPRTTRFRASIWAAVLTNRPVEWARHDPPTRCCERRARAGAQPAQPPSAERRPGPATGTHLPRTSAHRLSSWMAFAWAGVFSFKLRFH